MPAWSVLPYSRLTQSGFIKPQTPRLGLKRSTSVAFLVSAVSAPAQLNTGRAVRSFTLNFGPQHPAAHGVVRLSMQVVGEVILRVDPQFGLLHRGSEKLMEARNLLQALPYFDRFDYVANLFQEHAYCLSIEALHSSKTTLAPEISLIRTLFDELSRIANHLLTAAAINMDMGAMGPMFWAFEEREQLMEFFERVSGARMHTAFYKPFQVDTSPLTRVFYRDVSRFLSRSARALSGAFLGLLNNRSLKTRFASVGQLSSAKLQHYGITGVIARSAGLVSDLRFNKNPGYAAYHNLSFRSFIGKRGDNWDRFLLRLKETVEAFRIIAQSVKQLAALPNSQPVLPERLVGLEHLNPTARGSFTGMEELISHFRLFSEGFPTQAGLVYKEVESPKGHVGVLLVTDGSSRPVRIKLRTPVAHNMNLIPAIGTGVLFADFVATFSSFDIVLGEIDR